MLALHDKLFRVTALAMLASLAGACGQSQLPDAMFATHAEQECRSSSTDLFFPNGTFDSVRRPDVGPPSAEFASKILASMHESPLSCGPNIESYRFLWIHSFSTWQPTAVRISRDGERAKIVAVRLQNAIDRTISERKETMLDAEGTQQALAAFSRFELWHKSSFAYEPAEDGAMWIVEGRLGTGYHAVLLVNADEDALRELALTLFRRSHMNPGQISRRRE